MAGKNKDVGEFGDIESVVEKHTGAMRFGARKLDTSKLKALGMKIIELIEKNGTAIKIPADYIEKKLGWTGGKRRGKPNHLKRWLNKLLADEIGAGNIIHVGQTENYNYFTFDIQRGVDEETEKKWKEWA